MNKKTLGLALGIIALIAGIVFIVVGIQQVVTTRQGGLLPKTEIEKAVADSEKEFVAYEHPQTKVRLSYPKNWTVTADKEGSGVAFSLYGGAVNLRLVSDDFSDKKEPVTLEEYSRVLMAQGKEEASKQNVAITPVSDSPAPLAGQPGHQWMYTVTIGDVKGRGMQVWTVKDKKSYVFTYTAANDLFDAFTPVVQRMIKTITLP